MTYWRWIGVALVVLGLLSLDGSPSVLGNAPDTASQQTAPRGAPTFAAAHPFEPTVVPSSGYDYLAPPSISKEQFTAVICQYRGTTKSPSPVCPEANDIYDFLVSEGFDPILGLAHMRKETEFGTTGIGPPGSPPGPSRGLYGVDCNSDADWCTGGRSQSAFTSYLNATRAWVKLMKSPTYIGRGLTTPDLVLPVYCPSTECMTGVYITNMHAWINDWRNGALQ